MIDLQLLVLVGAVVVVCFFYLWKLEPTGAAKPWALGWAAIYLAGILFGLSAYWPGVAPFAFLIGPLFPAYLLEGTLRFTGRRSRVSPLALGLAIGAVEATAVVVAGPSTAGLVSIPLELPLLATASLLLWLHRDKRSALEPERLMPLVVAGIGSLNVIDGLVVAGALELPLRTGLWVAVALLMAMLQIFSLLERGRRNERRAVADERRLRDLLQRSQKLETLGTLAGGVAHDFNNQLTAILGNASHLLEALPEDHPHRQPLSDLERAAEHCAELTRSLLAFARQAPVKRRCVDVAELCREAARMVGPSLPPDVSLELEIDDPLPEIQADPTQLRRVLTNLLTNARDAVGAAGRVRMRSRDCGPASGADPTDAGDWVEIVVEDDGPGMDAGTVERIFDPFFTRKDVGDGTGLGLSIVYGIVEAHGGRIEVESRPGEGARFRVRWPVGDAGRETRLAPTAAVARPLPGPATILVADDEPAVRRLTRRVLEGHGCLVLEAADGEEALRVLERGGASIDLLLVDLSMPRRSGLEVLAALRARGSRLPAILMSGHLEDRSGRLPSGVERLDKPFEPRALLGLVEALMGDTAR